MESHLRHWVAAIVLACAPLVLIGAAAGIAAAQSNDNAVVSANGSAQTLELTAAQRSAIYEAVRKDKSKVAPRRFSTAVGAEVPPMIELYLLPNDILAANPTAKFYKYTMVQDQVVLVDPTNMRVIAVIGPKRQQ
jgi:Protein of unknown function (DUF1236)